MADWSESLLVNKIAQALLNVYKWGMKSSIRMWNLWLAVGEFGDGLTIPVVDYFFASSLAMWWNLDLLMIIWRSRPISQRQFGIKCVWLVVVGARDTLCFPSHLLQKCSVAVLEPSNLSLIALMCWCHTMGTRFTIDTWTFFQILERASCFRWLTMTGHLSEFQCLSLKAPVCQPATDYLWQTEIDVGI